MEESIEDLLARYGMRVTNNKIHLGWENGWSDKTVELYRALLKKADKDSHTRSGNASDQSFSMKIKEGENVYTVYWSLDSGD